MEQYEYQIQDLRPGLISGVEVQLPGAVTPYKEGFFEWSASTLMACFQTPEVTGGLLKAWHHAPVFHEIEWHVDAEVFYFIRGTALMLFMDIAGGRPVMESGQIARIRAGTQIVISAGKAHFVAVAEGDEPVEAVVVAPRMDAPRMALPAEAVGR